MRDLAKNKKRKKSRRPGLTEEQKRRYQQHKRKLKRKDFIYSSIVVCIMLLITIFDSFAYEIFEYYGWSISIVDSIYIIIDILITLLYFGIGCLMVWVLFFIIKAIIHSKQYKNTSLKSFITYAFLLLFIIGLGTLFFYLSINHVISYLLYYLY